MLEDSSLVPEALYGSDFYMTLRQTWPGDYLRRTQRQIQMSTDPETRSEQILWNNSSRYLGLCLDSDGQAIDDCEMTEFALRWARIYLCGDETILRELSYSIPDQFQGFCQRLRMNQQ